MRTRATLGTAAMAVAAMALSVVSAAVGRPAHAQTAASPTPLVLTFEGITTTVTPGDTPPIGSFYAGGAGPNLGVGFSGNASAICLQTPATQGCSGVSRGGEGDAASQRYGLFFRFVTTFDTVGVLNRPDGFGTGFSFFYVGSGGYDGRGDAPLTTASFTVWSGLDGTGTALASSLLPATPTSPGTGSAPCFTAPGCPFVPIGVSFAGLARSVTFTGVTGSAVFDDVTLGSTIPGLTTVPEPSTWLLVASGLLGVGAAARRRRGVRL